MSFCSTYLLACAIAPLIYYHSRLISLDSGNLFFVTVSAVIIGGINVSKVKPSNAYQFLWKLKMNQ